MFTALAIVEDMLKVGTARRAMVVSGEHITHLMRTAQLEIDGFMDPRLASLTLGDAGLAMILEQSSGEAGFHALDLYTLGGYHAHCVAKATNRDHGGAVMLTDPIKSATVAIPNRSSTPRARYGKKNGLPKWSNTSDAPDVRNHFGRSHPRTEPGVRRRSLPPGQYDL